MGGERRLDSRRPIPYDPLPMSATPTPTQPASPRMTLCPHCDAEAPASDEICPGCGRDLPHGPMIVAIWILFAALVLGGIKACLIG